jgi:hypothetical protein
MADIVSLDISIRQGAEYRAEYQRVKARFVFEALTTGVSDASAPAFPTDLEATVVDNTVTWINKGVWSPDLEPSLSVWLPSTGYSKRAKVITPIDPVDLTGYTGAFQIRDTVEAASPLHSGTVVFGTRVEGKFNMIISTADTTNFTFDEAVYDLELSTAGGEVDFVVRGNALLIKEVTR